MGGRRCRSLVLQSTAVLAIMSSPGLSFLSPPACPLSSLHRDPPAKYTTTAVARRADVSRGARGIAGLDAGTKADFSGAARDREPSEASGASGATESSKAGGGVGSPSAQAKGPPQAASKGKPPSSKQMPPSINRANQSTSSAKPDFLGAGGATEASKAQNTPIRTNPPSGASPGGVPADPTGTAAVAPDAAAAGEAGAAGAAAAGAVVAEAAGGASKAARSTGDASSSKGGVAPQRSKGKGFRAAKTAEANGAAAEEGAGGVAGSSADGKEDDVASFLPFRKTKQNNNVGVAAAPETTAAEKVLSLLDLGLVDKDEVAAYYDALSDLERTTREAKEAALTTASPDPAPPASNPFSSLSSSPQEGPLSLVPFPAVCAALGAAGAHSLHLTGGLDSAASTIGAIAGVCVGSLVVAGDDPVGRAARTFGAAVARSVGSIGGQAGKSVTDSAAKAVGAAVVAAEEALLKAPANAAAGLGKSLSSGASALVGSVLALPGDLARKAVGATVEALQDTTEVVVSLPGDVARKAAEAAGGAIQSTSDAAITALKDSPKEAAKRLNEAVVSPGETLAAFASRASSGAGADGAEERRSKKVQPASTTPASAARDQPSPTAPAISKIDEEVPEGIPLEELEAKMSSVQEALERFDAVKGRIENAQTSGTLSATIGMTRKIDATAENARSGAARTAKDGAAQTSLGGKAEATRSRPPRASPTAIEEKKPIDEKRRKQLAEQLLEKASKRATDAKVGLKAAAASARRDADETDAVTTAPAVGVGAGQHGTKATVA